MFLSAAPGSGSGDKMLTQALHSNDTRCWICNDVDKPSVLLPYRRKWARQRRNMGFSWRVL